MCLPQQTVFDGQPGCHHVRIPDGFHFVDVVTLDAGVEQSVDGVEEANDLRRGAEKVCAVLDNFSAGQSSPTPRKWFL